MTGPQQLTVDIDGGMEKHNTAGWANLEGHIIRHTFSLFANPLLGQDRPDPNDPDVLTVAPGTQPPLDFTESTLYFLPGVHTPRTIPSCCSAHPFGCVCTKQDTAAPGFVTPAVCRTRSLPVMPITSSSSVCAQTELYLLQSNKNYYVPSDAWIDGSFDTREM